MGKALAFFLALWLCACGGEKKIVVPPVFRVNFTTTQGDIVVEASKSWSPHGVNRFYELVNMRYFDQSYLFRVVPGFIAQFGLNKDYEIHDRWRKYFIVDDPRTHMNLRATLAFAQAGPNTRATEIFINLADNKGLDEQDFVPFAKVIEGMDVVDKLYSGYGEMMPDGKFIDPNRAENGTNAYLEPRFPKLDRINRAVFLK